MASKKTAKRSRRKNNASRASAAGRPEGRAPIKDRDRYDHGRVGVDVLLDELGIFADPLPSQVANVLASHAGEDLEGLTGGGSPLWQYLGDLYTLRAEIASAEKTLLARIGERSPSQSLERSLIQFRYILLRIAGAPAELLATAPRFLDDGMTWESVEREFVTLDSNGELSTLVFGVFAKYRALRDATTKLQDAMQEGAPSKPAHGENSVARDSSFRCPQARH